MESTKLVTNVTESSFASSHSKNMKKIHVEGMGPDDEPWRRIPQRDRLILTLWHTMMGTMSLLAWNMVLNGVLVMEGVLWEGQLLSDILLGCNQAGAVCTVLTLIYLDNITLNPTLARAINVLILVALCMLPIPAFLFQGNEHINAAKGFLCFTVFLLGIGAGIYQAQSFGFAALIPRRRDQSIFISTGNGVGGVISWLTFTICYEGIFDKDTVSDMQMLILIMSVVGVVCLAVTYALLEMCLRMPIFIEKLEEAKAIKQQEQAAMALAVEEGKGGGEIEQTKLWPTIKQALYPGFRVGFVLFITILVFPGCGPYGWPISLSLANINMGVFQIGDLVFRFVPALGSWTIFSVRLTEVFVFGRTIFLLPFFIIPVYLTTAPFISHAAWLTFCMVIMVLTNGWAMTCAIIHCMGTAKNKKEAETTANVMTLFIVLGALFGAFGSKVPLLGN